MKYRPWMQRWWWRNRLAQWQRAWPWVSRKDAIAAQVSAVAGLRARHEQQLEDERKQIRDIMDRMVGVRMEHGSLRNTIEVRVTIDARLMGYGGGLDRDMELLAEEAAGRVRREIRNGRVWSQQP